MLKSWRAAIAINAGKMNFAIEVCYIALLPLGSLHSMLRELCHLSILKNAAAKSAAYLLHADSALCAVSYSGDTSGRSVLSGK